MRDKCSAFWLRSYLSGRGFSVGLGDFISSSVPLICGIPQGSILEPILFLSFSLLASPQSWMASNSLNLNENKTEVIILGLTWCS